MKEDQNIKESETSFFKGICKWWDAMGLWKVLVLIS